MRYQYKFKLTEQDYFEYNKYHPKNKALAKRETMLTRYLFMPILLITMGMIFINEFGIPAGIMYIVIAILVFYPFSHFQLKMIRWFKDKRLKEAISKLIANNCAMSEEITFTFGEESFTAKTSETESQYEYSTMTQLYVGDFAIYLHMSNTTAYIIPKSVFSGEDEINTFAAFLNAKIIPR